MELSYVLDELLGVMSKILSVNSGSEIEGRAAELIAHFQQQVRSGCMHKHSSLVAPILTVTIRAVTSTLAVRDRHGTAWLQQKRLRHCVGAYHCFLFAW